MSDVQPYRFEVRDHAADKAATAYGETLDQVFEAAAYAMFDIMIDLATVRIEQEREMRLESPYGEELLQAWLSELLFAFEVEGMVFREFSVRVRCPSAPEQTCRRVEAFTEPPGELWRMTGIARGAPFSERIERRGAAVKAVTYHNFALRPPPAPGGDWVAEKVFDV